MRVLGNTKYGWLMDNNRIKQLYQTLGPLVYRRCLKLLRDSEMARDATQEVFVRTLKKADNLEDDRGCLPWLYRVSTNYCLNLIRDSKKTQPLEDVFLANPSSIENQLLAKEKINYILSNFDQRTQEIIIYSQLDGMTQEEIATVMKISRRAVNKRFNKYKKALEVL
jgi:RNA polymerase sigma-70 factor (ECF subfamily)